MRRSAAALCALALLALTACHAEEDGGRLAALREKYAAGMAYTATAAVTIHGETEELSYTLRFDADGGETRVTVLEPALLAGVTACLSGDSLALEYDGLVLDAGGAIGGVNAVSCVPLALRAVGEGWLLDESTETIGRGGEDVRALRACFEAETDGETRRCTVWFGESDAPLRARIEENEKITADMEFTSFAFCDTMTSGAGG